MARYTGPKARIARKFGEPILGACKALARKNYPPGQHGKKRKKTSDYGEMLKEKQKAKYIYGTLERPFKNLFRKAAARKSVTGEIALQLLETRLADTIFRLNLAPTRSAARQLVSHGHILVGNKKVNIPSAPVQVGDVITIKQSYTQLASIKERLKNARNHSWLSWDMEKMEGKLLRLPSREAIPEKINEQRIIELYSK